MIRNDADIVEAFVRHTLRLLDHLFVIVHCPEDGTDEILGALGAEGLPMTLVIDDEPAYLQAERLTWLARRAHAALPSDFVFVLDADEFLVPDERQSIEAALGSLPPDVPAARLAWRTFVPTAEDAPGEINPLRRIRHRLRDEATIEKVVLTRAFEDDPALVLDQGSHGLLRIGAPAARLPLPALAGIGLAHYPVRSAAQIANKTILGYLALLAAGRPHAEERSLATHWRRCYEDMVLRGATQGMSEQQMVAWFHGRQVQWRRDDFVCDPTRAPDELRYAHLVRNDSYATLARFAEHVIRKRPAELNRMRFERPFRPGAPTGRFRP